MFKLIALVLALMPGMLHAGSIVELPKKGSNKIVIRFQFKNGAIADPKGKEGLTSLTAQMVMESGTGDWTKADIDNMIYPMAASYGASTDKEVVNMTFRFPSDFEKEFYPVVSGLLKAPNFDQKDLDRVRASRLNYVTRSVRNSNDEDYSKVALEDFLFRGTNYEHLVSGTKTGLESITLEDVKKHYEQYFTADNVLVGIAGNYSKDLLAQLRKDVSELPKLAVSLPEAGAAVQPNGIEIEIISKPGAIGSAIYMGYPLEPTRASDDFAALTVMASYLGEHRKSYGRLYRQIREKRSMNYGDYAYVEWYPNGSSNLLPVSGSPRSSNYFSVWLRPVQLASGLSAQYQELAGLEVGHAHFAIRMAMYELEKLIAEGMSEEDVQLTKDFLRSYMKLYIKSLEQELGYLMDSRFYGRNDYIAEMNEQIKALTREEITRVIRTYLQTDNMRMVIVTSPDEAKALKVALLANSPSPMSYSNEVKEGLDPEILAEDEVVATFDLPVRSVRIIPTEASLE